MSPQNTAFVLVPGACSPPSFYDKVIPLLSSKGYAAYPTALLSAGRRPEGPATFEEDAAFIHAAVLKLAEEGKDVVLAVNSYGGFPGTEASKGLSKSERQKEGKKGGIVALVYIASFVPAVGMSVNKLMGNDLPGSNTEEYMELNVEDYKNIFSDMSDADGRKYMAQMLNQSLISLSGELTYPGYKFIPSTLILAEQDKTIPPETQRSLVDAANNDGANITVVPIQSGHVPMLSQPQKIAEILIDVATKL